MDDVTLLNAWLREAEHNASGRASVCREAFKTLKDPNTAYGRQIWRMVIAHAEAAAVYRRALVNKTETAPACRCGHPAVQGPVCQHCVGRCGSEAVGEEHKERT